MPVGNPANQPAAQLDAVRTAILYYASLAPSGHNTQPWVVKIRSPNDWIIGAGVSYLVCRGRQVSIYNGVDLQSEAGWQRLEEAIDTMINGLLTGSGK